jgi:hypothetical protein
MKLKHKPQREAKVSDDQLSRLNHLRERAGLNPLSKEEAEEFLSKCSLETYNATMERILA